MLDQLNQAGTLGFRPLFAEQMATRMYDAACVPGGSRHDLFQLADLRRLGIYRCSYRLESLGKALLARIAPTLIAHDPARKNAARFSQGFEAVRNVNLSPKMAPASMMMSPRSMPMRNSIRRSAGAAAFARPSRCTSTAQRTASTTLRNSRRRQCGRWIMSHRRLSLRDRMSVNALTRPP